eukprot:CAMPEP_0171597480 /NCGR_PEP_ID=MMETSP0990-20121206/2575_1 /TAXON_ID=483369 /ORGANISM="non described non described, Strain CCMP2098" /LENGTH=144 /DNA_ID=CAMNT_0012158899 /DNA_START=208 /DNA_END=644 /DNA_ORIENTATION=-
MSAVAFAALPSPFVLPPELLRLAEFRNPPLLLASLKPPPPLPAPLFFLLAWNPPRLLRTAAVACSCIPLVSGATTCAFTAASAAQPAQTTKGLSKIGFVLSPRVGSRAAAQQKGEWVAAEEEEEEEEKAGGTALAAAVGGFCSF